MALKDDAGLVKKYAMVNVQKYQVVAIGDTVSVCEESYNNLLLTNGIKEKEEVKMDTGIDRRKDHENRPGRYRWRFSLLHYAGMDQMRFLMYR